MACKKCGSTNTVKNGRTATGQQRYHCRACGAYAGPSEDAPFGGSPPSVVIVRYGNLYAIYQHLSAVTVETGEFVVSGQEMALSGNFGSPQLHFEVRPVPQSMLANTDPDQPGVNPGYAVNPLDYFDAETQAYLESQYDEPGGDSHFCRGSLYDQEQITFGGPVNTRPCTE
jgi:hypothetical protein